ncbi:MAG: hypothetical protein IPJ40_18275 [Saprospirales bacterium]|nr:hypothetical protein [Saprospirales bacterium]
MGNDVLQRQDDGVSSPHAAEDLQEQDQEDATQAPPAIQQKSNTGGMAAPPGLAARLQATKGGGSLYRAVPAPNGGWIWNGL